MSSAFSPEEIRMMAHAAPTFLRMLEAKERSALNKIYGMFRTGEKDFIAVLAEWATLRDQISDIKRALQFPQE